MVRWAEQVGQFFCSPTSNSSVSFDDQIRIAQPQGGIAGEKIDLATFDVAYHEHPSAVEL